MSNARASFATFASAPMAGATGGLPLPTIIQGGMGVAVSNWRLARAVSGLGQLGVVSGTGIDTVFVRRLQDGDPGAHLRRAMASFPFADVVRDALQRYFLPAGRAPGAGYRRLPLPTVEGTAFQRGLTALASFTEVFLAKEGHDAPVGLNLLTKVQLPNLATLYGAMLAGVDVVLMGAGIPREIPGALDELAGHRPAALTVDVAGARAAEPTRVRFDPAEFGDQGLAPTARPAFLPIVSSHSLASMLLKKASGAIAGFVVENSVAGGHNAPPRGGNDLDAHGQPIYGERDRVDLHVMRELGVPFWLAGAAHTPAALREAVAAGAAGVQVGTLFAFCEESGLDAGLKEAGHERARAGTAAVFTDPAASPTGFPFKVLELPATLSDDEVYATRTRRCDLGYLRQAYRTEDGEVGYRCAAEPIADYVAKGGRAEDTVGRKCLCNALMANVGLAQTQPGGHVEPPLVTSGDDVAAIAPLLPAGKGGYTAADVVDYLLGPV
jgi:NAD(P)H-dependent flavin oxidoreductase YrpB (nitropropane dioxygenase family)